LQEIVRRLAEHPGASVPLASGSASESQSICGCCIEALQLESAERLLNVVTCKVGMSAAQFCKFALIPIFPGEKRVGILLTKTSGSEFDSGCTPWCAPAAVKYSTQNGLITENGLILLILISQGFQGFA
jgi:hypothetical protein